MFNNFKGYQKEKEMMERIINTYKNEDMCKKFGIKKIKSVLLTGSFGIGKTTFVQDIIQEMNVKTFIFRYFKNKEDSIKDLNDMFKEASKEEVSLLIVEDFDSFYDINKSLYYVLMNNIKEYKDKNILIIATYNHPSSFALHRIYPFIKLFDEWMHLRTPEKEESLEIIKFILKDKKISPDFNYEDLNEAYSYLDSCEFKSLVNESVISQGYKRKEYLEVDDIITIYLKNHYMPKLDDTKIEIITLNALKNAGKVAISEVLNKDSCKFVAVNQESIEDYWQEDKVQVLINLGALAAIELFNVNDSNCEFDDEIRWAVSNLRCVLDTENEYSSGFFRENYTSKKRELKCINITEELLNKYLIIAKEILSNNKKFVLRLYHELSEKHYLLSSDIKRIRSSVEIIPFKGNL